MAGRRVERFLTTVLFTDIVGSTELAAELGDRGWRDLVQEHHRLVRAALRRHGGREVDTAGDSFFAVFDAPAAAVECALEVVRVVEPLGIQVRAGLHVGEVEQIAGKVGGITVPIGSRIMGAAEAGEVLVSGTVHDLAAGAGLKFEDRGTRELKGVPGEWHLYAVTHSGRRPEQLAETSGVADLSEAAEPERAARRAATIRRSQSRPIWQRHQRATLGVALVLILVLATTGLLVWSPWLPPALAGVAENSVGIIDPGRNVIDGQAAVGIQPGAMAEGEGSVWVANTGDGTISRLDPRTHTVVDTIDVGKNPSDVTVGAGSVWVANSGERSVTRINAATGRVVDTIEVGNGPRSVAFGADAVWVANTGDGTVTRIDAATGVPGEPIRFASLPSALAVDDTGVWVVSEDGGSVTHLDPTSGVALAAPIPVGIRPSAVAIGDGVVWVANAGDGSVSGIDPVSNRLTSVINVGGIPVALAVMGSTLWVGNADASLERVNLAQPSIAPVRIATGSIAQAVAVIGNDLWFVSRASAATHRGGTIHVVGLHRAPMDPNAFGSPEFRALIGDGLVGYRRVGGIAGTQLVPDLATALPQPTDGGLTYTFRLRPDLVYSDGSPLRPDDFTFTLERAFQVADPIFGNSAEPYAGLVGADACAEPPVEHCDLSQGVVADDAANTVTFHLAKPDPKFLYALALPSAQAMREGAVPANDLIVGPHPVTGPYEIAAVGENEVRLERNPRFHSWDSVARPDGYADEIIWTWGVDPAAQVNMVESGAADYMDDQIPADAFSALRTQFTPQLHIASSSTTFLFMNTALAPFDRPEVRRAVNLAIDRAKVAELRGGAIAAQPTCQYLPPNFPGYMPYCPYTSEAGPSGRWTGPDVDAARSLVAQSGTAGMKVVVGPMPLRLTPVSEYVASVLRDLGYDATAEVPTDDQQVFQANFLDQRVQIGGFEFYADFPSPDSFLGGFACDPGDPLTHYCDANLDSLIAQARGLQATDPAAANSKWAEVDRMIADLAILAPLVNEGSDLVSARLGNYQFNPAIGVLLDQAWVN